MYLLQTKMETLILSKDFQMFPEPFSVRATIKYLKHTTYFYSMCIFFRLMLRGTIRKFVFWWGCGRMLAIRVV